jgi:hypothetical protein
LFRAHRLPLSPSLGRSLTINFVPQGDAPVKKYAALAALFLCLLPAAARADVIAIQIFNAIRVAPAGFTGSETITGTLTNTSGVAVTIDHIGGMTSQVGSGATYVPLLTPPLTLQAGETITADLFRIDVTGPLTYTAGTYSVNRAVGAGFASLGSAYWQLTVGFGSPGQPLPEPTTFLLLTAGLAGVAARARRRLTG